METIPSRTESNNPNTIGPEVEPSAGLLLRAWLNLPEPLPGLLCPRNGGLQLGSHSRPDVGRAERSRCGCWRCPVCRVREQQNRGLHFSRKFLACAGKGLFTARITAPAWPALKTSINRAHESFVRIDLGHGLGALTTTHPHLCAVPVPLEEAVRSLGQWLLHLELPPGTRRWQPVTSSRDWQPARPPSDFYRTGSARTQDPEAVLALLAGHGIRGARKRQKRNEGETGEWAVSWKWPGEWDEARREDFRDQVAALE